nr:class I SAM-dependent methyltransferase [Jiella sp. LLJ827]
MDLGELTADGVLADARDRPLRMLDVGGGNGIFVYVFRQQAGRNASDWSAAIVDPGAQGQFVERFGIGYFQRRFDDAFAAGLFHLITMNYLLEHVADPRAVLQTAAANLATGGALYIEVPDALAFQRRPPEDDIFNACHLWMFDPPALITLLSEVGLSSLRMRRTKSPRGHYALSVLAGRP